MKQQDLQKKVPSDTTHISSEYLYSVIKVLMGDSTTDAVSKIAIINTSMMLLCKHCIMDLYRELA